MQWPSKIPDSFFCFEAPGGLACFADFASTGQSNVVLSKSREVDPDRHGNTVTSSLSCLLTIHKSIKLSTKTTHGLRLKMTFDLENKIVLITGANRGIGASLVKAFLLAGAKKVYAAVRSIESASHLVETYGKDKVFPILIDLADPKTITTAAKEASDVEVVVNNAGVLKVDDPLADTATSSLEYQMNVNVYGLLHMAQAFAPVLKSNGGGVFAQLNSVVSMKSFSNVATYSASKAAAYSLTQALREVLQEQGTTVVSVHPGPVATDMADQAGMREMAESPDVVANAVLKAVRNQEFHVFPDSMAQQIGGAYESFAKNVVEGQTDEVEA
jgi:NAD(P)-dependent dehydrogenase (short-subunit alcohol dehydrogenase family)